VLLTSTGRESVADVCTSSANAPSASHPPGWSAVRDDRRDCSSPSSPSPGGRRCRPSLSPLAWFAAVDRRDSIAVHRDAYAVQRFLCHSASYANRAQINQKQVVVGATGDNTETQPSSSAALPWRSPQTLLIHRKSGCRASWKHTALAQDVHQRALVCPGTTAESRLLASSCLASMKPPRGPRSVFCVVAVTTCAHGTGVDGSHGNQACRWAISTITLALFHQHRRILSKSMLRG